MNGSKMMAAAMVLAMALPAMAQSVRTTMPSDYDVLSRKSIFSKDRAPRGRRGGGPGGSEDGGSEGHVRRPPPRQYTPVLVGTMLEDDGYVAFIVNPSTQEIAALRVGDALPSNAGVLKDITLDYVETASTAEKPGKRVLIGQNILGGPAEYPATSGPPESASAGGPPPTSEGPPASAEGGPAGSPAAAPAASSGSSDTSSIAERMRKRRLQQLGK